MKINFEKNDANIYKKYSKYFGFGFILILIHLYILNYIEVFGIIPDLLLIISILVTIKEGRLSGLLFSFILCLFFDIFNNEIYGLTSISKLFVVFLAGFYYDEGKSILILSKFKFTFLIFIFSIFSNLIFYFFDQRILNFSFYNYFIYYILGNSIYTTLVSSIVVVYYSNKRY